MLRETQHAKKSSSSSDIYDFGYWSTKTQTLKKKADNQANAKTRNATENNTLQRSYSSASNTKTRPNPSNSVQHPGFSNQKKSTKPSTFASSPVNDSFVTTNKKKSPTAKSAFSHLLSSDYESDNVDTTLPPKASHNSWTSCRTQKDPHKADARTSFTQPSLHADNESEDNISGLNIFDTDESDSSLDQKVPAKRSYKKPSSCDSDSISDTYDESDINDHQNIDFTNLYERFAHVNDHFSATDDYLQNETEQNFHSYHIENINKSIQILNGSKQDLRQNLRRNLLLSIYHLILVGDLIGQSMKRFVGSCERILKLGLDFLSELSMLAKSNLIKESNRRSKLEKKGEYILGNKDLNIDIGYSFGLAMLVTLSENIYDDIQQAYFQSKEEDTVPLTVEEFRLKEHSFRGMKRIKRATAENIPAMEAKPSFISNFFKGASLRHECCIICKKNNNQSVRHCLGCGSCLHVEGSCYNNWYKEPEMNWNGNQIFLCPSCTTGQALVQASYENNLHLTYDLLVIKAGSPFYKYVLEPNKPNVAIENTTALHITVTQNNYTLTSMLLCGAYELLQTSKRSESDIQSSFPNVCWGRDGCHYGFQKQCWREYKCQQLNHCRLTPFQRAFHTSKINLCYRPPIESMLLLSFRGGGNIETIQTIQKIRLSQEFQATELYDGEEYIPLPKSDISLGAEAIPIPWVNETNDGAILKADFVYITQPVESKNTRISWFPCRNQKWKQSKKMLASWEKKNRTPQPHTKQSMGCSKAMNSALKRLQQIGPSVQCECNYLCPCRDFKRRVPAANGRRDIIDCGNRTISSGLKHKLQIFRTVYKGWGVRTLQTINKGDLIFCYAGIYLWEKDMDDLAAKEENVLSPSYVMNLTVKQKKNDVSAVINGDNFRSVAGFVNHECCKANLEIFHSFGNHLDGYFPMIGFRAKDNIGPYTELNLNYGVKLIAMCPICMRNHCLCDHCMDDKHDPTHARKRECDLDLYI